jgi:glycosyltransferase involved in cell wall biosynthesis
MINVLFVRTHKSTFIQKDIELLKRNFNVGVLDFKNDNGINLVYSLLKLVSLIPFYDVTFSWFGDVHAFWAIKLSKKFKKKSIVVIGGYELADMPSINYGLLSEKKSAKKVEYILTSADLVLTVEEGLRMEAINRFEIDESRIKTIHTGYDFNLLKADAEKFDLVVTVALCHEYNRAILKGLPTFVRSAKYLSDVHFVLIGVQGGALSELQKISPSNVEFIGPLEQEGVLKFYEKAKCYCQLSLREGLPNSLCEAMLYKCVPVGTRVQGITTAIGDTGYYVPCCDPIATADGIKMAMNSQNGNRARNRIMKMFPIEKRERELNDNISKIITNA